MSTQRSPYGARVLTVSGLVVGSVGIAVLWASGIEFPIYPPPGILILLAGAVFTLTPLWAPGMGAFLGLFVFIGFLASPTGLTNLVGDAGTSVAIGQGVQAVGVLTAAIAGVIGTWANYRRPAETARSDLRA